MNVGDKVRVKIRDASTFASGAAKSLDGAAGTVTKHSAKSYNGDGPGPSEAWLVEFDEPRERWHTRSHGAPITAFWFPPGDLGAL